jgi:hypothetical protein
MLRIVLRLYSSSTSTCCEGLSPVDVDMVNVGLSISEGDEVGLSGLLELALAAVVSIRRADL